MFVCENVNVAVKKAALRHRVPASLASDGALFNCSCIISWSATHAELCDPTSAPGTFSCWFHVETPKPAGGGNRSMKHRIRWWKSCERESVSGEGWTSNWANKSDIIPSPNTHHGSDFCWRFTRDPTLKWLQVSDLGEFDLSCPLKAALSFYQLSR